MGIESQASQETKAPENTPDHSVWQKALFYLEKQALAPEQGATAAPKGQYKSVDMKVDGDNRQYEVYVPTKFDPAKPARVIMGLHGSIFGQDGARGLMARETGLDEAVEKRAGADNALVVYPIAKNRTASMITGQTWNYAGHKNIFDTWNNYDDGKYMDGIFKDLKSNLKVSEIDGVGFGDGGRFLKAYGDDHPGTFDKMVLQNSTTLGGTPKEQAPGAKTDYLIMHSVRDPQKSSTWDEIKHPFTTNMALPYEGGYGALSWITPNVSGIKDSRPYLQKVEAARANRCEGLPDIKDTAKERITTYRNCQGGAVVERLEKNAQMAWNDLKYGDGGHGIFALFGARSDFADTDATLDFILNKPEK